MKFDKESWMQSNNTMDYNDIINAGGENFLNNIFNELNNTFKLDDFNMEPYIKFDFDNMPYFKFKAQGIMYHSDYPTNKEKDKYLCELEDTLMDLGFEDIEVNYYNGRSEVVGDDGVDVIISAEHEII